MDMCPVWGRTAVRGRCTSGPCASPRLRAHPHQAHRAAMQERMRGGAPVPPSLYVWRTHGPHAATVCEAPVWYVAPLQVLDSPPLRCLCRDAVQACVRDAVPVAQLLREAEAKEAEAEGMDCRNDNVAREFRRWAGEGGMPRARAPDSGSQRQPGGPLAWYERDGPPGRLAPACLPR